MRIRQKYIRKDFIYFATNHSLFFSMAFICLVAVCVLQSRVAVYSSSSRLSSNTIFKHQALQDSVVVSTLPAGEFLIQLRKGHIQ